MTTPETEPERLVSVASFYTAPEAHLAQGELEAAGIDSCLEDESLVSMHGWASFAIGGIKLMVKESDLPRAREAIDDDRARSEATPADPEYCCPKCGSTDLEYGAFSVWSMLLVLLAARVMFPGAGKRNWRCQRCGWRGRTREPIEEETA